MFVQMWKEQDEKIQGQFQDFNVHKVVGNLDRRWNVTQLLEIYHLFVLFVMNKQMETKENMDLER